MTTSWSEGTVTWNSRPSWTCCEASAAVDFSIGTDYVWAVATLVDHWVNNSATYPNGGVALTGPSGGHQRAFASRDAGSNPPRLVVDYTPPPPDGTIVAEVHQAIVSKKNDDFLLPIDALVQQDFYLKMRVNGQPEVISRVVPENDFAPWTPSPFSESADVIKALRTYTVGVELWDSDPEDPTGDDQFDITPEAGKTLTVTFDACTLRWSVGSNLYGPRPDWIPYPMAEGVENLAQIQIEIRTSDGRSFAPNDVAIAYAEPVQTVYGPREIIAEKATALWVDLSSSWTVDRNAEVIVTMSDGVSTVNQTKHVVVPPDGRLCTMGLRRYPESTHYPRCQCHS